MPRIPRTWIDLSSSALRHNFRQFRRRVGPGVGILPVVKANAYGHGLAQVITVLKKLPLYGLGVAYGQEALAIRAMGYRGRIVVLSNWQTAELSDLVNHHVEMVVWDFPSLAAVGRLAARHNRQPKIHLKLDTGTSRIGFLPTELPLLRLSIQRWRLRPVGIFSHLANSEEQRSIRTIQQIKRFTTLVNELSLRPGIRHLSCTASAIRYPQAHFGLIRPGIGIYGVWPSIENRTWAASNIPWFTLRPVLSWWTRLVQVKRVPAGTFIGYGSTRRVIKATRIGLVPIGYADGYDRRLSDLGRMHIHGRSCPVLGRVSMNLTAIDLGRLKVRAGQAVAVIAPQEQIIDWPSAAGVFSYELLSRLSPTINRRVVA